MLASATPKTIMNSAKRRRLNDNNAAILSKPFRSPLKSSPGQSKSVHSRDNHEQQDSERARKPITDLISPALEHKGIPEHPEDVVQLQRDYAALCQQLRHRRQTLDVLKQALAVASSGQPDKLKSLVAKWRIIAREAADEVYESTSAQVKDMGGLVTMQKHSQELASDWHDNTRNVDASDLDDGDDCTTNSRLDGDPDQSDFEEVKPLFA